MTANVVNNDETELNSNLSAVERLRISKKKVSAGDKSEGYSGLPSISAVELEQQSYENLEIRC